MAQLTADRMDAVLAFLPILKKRGFVAGTWRGGEKIRAREFVMAFMEYSPVVSRLVAALYDNGFIDSSFNWGAWQRSALAYMRHPERIRKARLGTLVKLLTIHVRNDRFCEGHLHEMIRNGHIRAVLERLAVIRRAMGR